MSASIRFEPEAWAEYRETIRYYAMEADCPEVAGCFVAAVESAMAAICAAPELWRLVQPPDVRRYVLRRFPFVL